MTRLKFIAEFVKAPILVIIGLITVFAVVLSVYYSDLPDYWQGLAVESAGMAVEVILVVFALGIFEYRRKKSEEIKTLRRRIDDYKRLDTPEAKTIIASALRELAQHGVTDIDFSGIHLREFSFEEQEITSLQNSVFFDRPIRKTCLDSVNFDNINCKNIVFGDSDSTLGSRIINCTFNDSNLTGAKFGGSTIEWKIERDPKNWDEEYEEYAEFPESGGSFQSYFPMFWNADLDGADFSYSILKDVDFRGAINVLKANFRLALGVESCEFDPGIKELILETQAGRSFRMSDNIKDHPPHPKTSFSMRKILKFFARAIGGLIAVCLVIVAGVSAYHAYQARPRAVTTLEGVTLGDSLRDTKFKVGELSYRASDTAWELAPYGNASMNIQEFRQKYPQYNDLSDQQLADSLHRKFYSDVPKAEFYQRIGLHALPDPLTPMKPWAGGWQNDPVVDLTPQQSQTSNHSFGLQDPIEAELFDGTILEFPKGTDPNIIARVAKEQTQRIKKQLASTSKQHPTAQNQTARYTLANQQTFFDLSEGTVRTIYHKCDRTFAALPPSGGFTPALNGVTCGTSGDEILEKFGQRVTVSCLKQDASTPHYDKDLLRLYATATYNVGYYLYQNRVVGFRVAAPETLAAQTLWEPCDAAPQPRKKP